LRRSAVIERRGASVSRGSWIGAGTPRALGDHMSPDERWTIPLEILIWTVLTVGLILVLVIFMLHA
jgi:hypothetical protein